MVCLQLLAEAVILITVHVGIRLRYLCVRQAKKKVDWDDVEAKAKKEAMWLLEYRKQQVRAVLCVLAACLPPLLKH